jgi:hypothetical protein
VKVTITLDDQLAAEVEQRAGDRTWTQIITDCLAYALAVADEELTQDDHVEPGAEQPQSDPPAPHPSDDYTAHTDNEDSTAS